MFQAHPYAVWSQAIMSGSIEAFADTMNQEAAALGATGTHFVNPHGLSDENHYTTAYDIYLILNEVSKYDKFMEIFTTRSREVSYTKADGSPTSAVYSISCWYFTGNTEAPEGVIPLGGRPELRHRPNTALPF